MYIKSFATSVLFLLLVVANNYAATNKDSLCHKNLHAYHVKYFNDPTDSIVLTASDTLLRMARECNDSLMEKYALGAKVDYYYYGCDENRTDSIIAWVGRIKEYAKKINNEELYYWAWSARLINNYLHQGEYNIALLEAERMLKEAKRSIHKENIADCYSSLTNIYLAKGLYGKALEFMLKEIDLFEKYNLKRHNISFQYSDAARVFINQDEPGEAAGLLKKALEYAKTPYHKVTAKQTYVLYYLAKGDILSASDELNESREIYQNEPAIRRHIHYLYDVETEFYIKTGKYSAALNSLELRKQELERKGEVTGLNTLDKEKADILWNLGEKDKAGELYRKYLEHQRVEKEKNEEVTTGEFATLLNIQKLNAENRELERIAQEKKLHSIQITVLSLVLLLIVVISFLYHQQKLNNKLKKSRNTLDKQNRILIAAEEELRNAKERAEQSSWMKTQFIQNMSHEIRTPLNSIVGFSAVLGDMFSEENEEIQQYAGMIEENSQLLLRLIGDILDISGLDNDPEIKTAPTDVNSCCMIAIDQSRNLFNAEIALSYNFEKDELIINSNSERITQVIRNLLTNASKFTEKGSVTVEYKVDENSNNVILTVTDTGIGIPDDQRERIFERFVKLNDFSQGTGLGLPISRIIAEKLGGSLVVDRKYTQGARFIFKVPM